MPNVFISYVRDNADLVDKLADELRQYGVNVWLDREQLMPGMRWQAAIRKAIRGGDFFIACFSAESVARTRTYQNEELVLAIEELRQRSADRIWFIPVLLSPCHVSDRDIGGGETFNSIQWVALYQNWEEGIRRILKAMRVEPAIKQRAHSVLVVSNDPIHMELIRIPAGEFLMGTDPKKDKGAFDDEVPQHQQFLPEYYIAKYPVTNEQYAVFAGRAKNSAPGHWQGGQIPLLQEMHPVVNISWHKAMAFCKWLSQATGESFRLPSEAEWEKAARGVDGRLYPWGDQPPTADLCNFGLNVGATTPVDRYVKGASPYGPLDMAGNVWEWTISLWGSYPYPSQKTQRRERENLKDWDHRVARAGSFVSDVSNVRCAFRHQLNPRFFGGNVGFRVCATVRRK